MSIAVTKTVYKVSDFLSWQRSNSLTLSPSFQRRPVWNESAKSYLIDTVVKGLPMPIIFLREKTNLNTFEPEREVVDGQQRLRTIISFIEAELLKDFDGKNDKFTVKKNHNPEIAGKNFSSLPDDIKKRILNYDFSVHVLPSDTEDAQVLQIFARMNSTGVKLNGQELRNAEYYGLYKSLMYVLSYEQLYRWRDWNVFSETNIARMDEVEETSDLVLLMIDGMHEKNKKNLDAIYKKKDNIFLEADEVARRFRIVMDEIDKSFGKKIRVTVFSRIALFNTLFTFFYDLIFGIGTTLSEKTKPLPLPNNIANILEKASNIVENGDFDNDELAKSLRGSTQSEKSRETRFIFLKNLLNNAQA